MIIPTRCCDLISVNVFSSVENGARPCDDYIDLLKSVQTIQQPDLIGNLYDTISFVCSFHGEREKWRAAD